MTLTDLLDKYGVPWRGADHHHVRKNWIGVDCPLCSPGFGKYRLGFELTGSQRTNCWFCGRVDRVEAVSLLCGIKKSEAKRVWRPSGRTLEEVDNAEHDGILTLPKGIGELQPAHIKYLKRRGFDPQVISTIWGVQGIGLASELAWRLFIPIHNERGRVVSWTTRAMNDKGLRYVSASSEHESEPHKSLLYGAHLAQHAVVVTEGPTDAWAIGPGAVATLGLGCTQTQLERLSRYAVRCVCFDSSLDAQRRAELLCRQLSVCSGTTDAVQLESGEDPADADRAEILELRSRYLDIS